jgi:hypothetical protein
MLYNNNKITMLIEQENKTENKLDEKSLARLDEFINAIDENSQFFTISDGQRKLITFDLENSIGFQKRTLYLDDGLEKQIFQFTFVVILRSGKKQMWNVSPKIAKQACRAIKTFRTTCLEVSRTGSDYLNTIYSFIDPEYKLDKN